MKAPGNYDVDLASPLDFWEMIALAWIRLAALTAHTFVTAMKPPQPSRIEPELERAQAEEQELLLHVLE